MSTAKEVLVKAKQIIIDRGWIQGQFRNAAGCVCSAGAINSVVVNPNDIALDGAYRLMRDVTSKAGGLVQFNDAEGRTVDEVLAKFDEAIALADKKAAQ